MKNSKIKKTFKKSVEKIFYKILKKDFLYFPKRENPLTALTLILKARL